ncbi:DUF1456 family protein [bacterium]|jgi:uncharacterized protein YehS (DUF1456 family)|nr:DUF1456 family protein [bacterium]MDG1432923.1 DUF1456 family protein [Saprospiraceae bacterium]
MNNNDVIRRVRYTFNFNDDKMIGIFALAEKEVSRSQISEWLKKDEDPDFKGIYDKDLASFLNGFINLRRGKKEGPQPKPEKTLNNNLILRKLKIALNLRDDEMVEIFDLVDMRISKHEINAFFRKPTQSQFRFCKDQFLRNFLFGIQKKYRQK